MSDNSGRKSGHAPSSKISRNTEPVTEDRSHHRGRARAGARLSLRERSAPHLTVRLRRHAGAACAAARSRRARQGRCSSCSSGSPARPTSTCTSCRDARAARSRSGSAACPCPAASSSARGWYLGRLAIGGRRGVPPSLNYPALLPLGSTESAMRTKATLKGGLAAVVLLASTTANAQWLTRIVGGSLMTTLCISPLPSMRVSVSACVARPTVSNSFF